MNNVITLAVKKHVARVDSQILAKHLDIQHKNVLALIDNNSQEFQEISQLAFQTRVISKKKAGQATRYALLTEDLAYFLLTLTRNTDRTKRLKLNLIQAFGPL